MKYIFPPFSELAHSLTAGTTSGCYLKSLFGDYGVSVRRFYPKKFILQCESYPVACIFTFC